MFTRLRRLKISLAAKCQLLFGAAVVFIVAAALFVPWRRMEQLMEKIDERAAASLADAKLNEHVMRQVAIEEGREFERPTDAPTSMPVVVDGKTFTLPRLIGLKNAESKGLTRFEKAAIKRFTERPDATFFSSHYEMKDGNEGYLYARPLYAEQGSCVRCHQNDEGARAAATMPAALAGNRRLMGLVSID